MNLYTREVTKTVEFKNGMHMPTLGFGTWGLENAREAVGWAIEYGYRHIDTAKIYNTETAVGEAVLESGIAREEIFITTKLWNEDQGYKPALKAIDESLEKLRMDYVDLYLIHWPLTNETKGENRRKETWTAMEEICMTGKAKAIGVSNFTVAHLEEMETYARMPPQVNQIELHPFLVEEAELLYCHENGIVVTNYSPLTRAEHLTHPVIMDIASTHGKSSAQVLLRFGLQLGSAVIPKSSKKEHIEENLHIYDFALTEDEMGRLIKLDRGESVS